MQFIGFNVIRLTVLRLFRRNLNSHLSSPGMTESIVAAAASRIGKKVLHLDR